MRLVEGTLGNRSNCLGGDSTKGAALRGIEAFADLADSGQLANADVEGLLGILGSPLIAVLFEADQDLIDLHRAIVALEHLHDGRGKRPGGRAGAGLTSQGRGSIGGFLARARRTATTAGNHCFAGRQHHGWLWELQGGADEFIQLDTQALDFLGDLIALLEDLAVLDGHWKSLK